MDARIEERTASEAVLAAVAEQLGVEEWELRPPLYEAVDPEALDDLFRETVGHATFEYQGFAVTVDADGGVRLAERSP